MWGYFGVFLGKWHCCTKAMDWVEYDYDNMQPKFTQLVN